MYLETHNMSTFQKPQDDYDWPSYTQIYAQQTADMQRDEKSDFILKNSIVKNGRIDWRGDNPHINWKQLYQTVIDLGAKEVFECGCGPAYHLNNIKHLSPDIHAYGIELLQTQLDFGREKMGVNPQIFDTVDVADFSIPCAACLLNYKYEFVYTQAVTMHLKHDKAVEFIRNMANISSGYVFLMENWNNHNYPDLLKESGILNVFDFQGIQTGEYQTYILLKK